MRDNKKEKSFSFEEVAKIGEQYSDLAFPLVSIVVATYNCAELISETLESIFVQKFPDIEVIIIDGGSEDRTLEVIKSFDRDEISIYSFREYNRYEMLNMGILHAKGGYINFLFPGDYYLHPRVLEQMMRLALQSDKPDLVYSACLLHSSEEGIQTLYRPLTLKLLRKGRQPTSLQSCWFRLDLFRKIGRFPNDYLIRGGYDLLCRFVLTSGLRHASLWRVTTDYLPRPSTRSSILHHFTETTKTIHKCFGLRHAIRWIFSQKDFSRLLSSWWHSIKVAITGS